MSRKRFGVRFGGQSDVQHDTCVKVEYFNIFGDSQADSYSSLLGGWSGGKADYSAIYSNYLKHESTELIYPVISSYQSDVAFNAEVWDGLVPVSAFTSQDYSIYRREYQVYIKPGLRKYGYLYEGDFYEDESHTIELPPMSGVNYIDIPTEYYYNFDTVTRSYSMVDKAKIYKGPWEPVIEDTNLINLYDYNIVNNKTYQYVIFLNYTAPKLDTDFMGNAVQVFANSDSRYKVWIQDDTYSNQGKLQDGSLETSNIVGGGVSTYWNDWSICELVPQQGSPDNFNIKNIYKVESSQIWRFRFSLETGSEKQNIARSDFQTLGQFIKIGYGDTNYSSGDVSAYMGSEIVFGSNTQYIERLNASRVSPLSTNERVEMLKEWKKFVSSKNPKLLKDIKGQSWIVQIVSSENTTKNFYNSVPDTINFQWKQIEDTHNVIIYSDVTSQPKEQEQNGKIPYEPIFK